MPHKRQTKKPIEMVATTGELRTRKGAYPLLAVELGDQIKQDSTLSDSFWDVQGFSPWTPRSPQAQKAIQRLLDTEAELVGSSKSKSNSPGQGHMSYTIPAASPTQLFGTLEPIMEQQHAFHLSSSGTGAGAGSLSSPGSPHSRHGRHNWSRQSERPSPTSQYLLPDEMEAVTAAVIAASRDSIPIILNPLGLDPAVRLSSATPPSRGSLRNTQYLTTGAPPVVDSRERYGSWGGQGVPLGGVSAVAAVPAQGPWSPSGSPEASPLRLRTPPDYSEFVGTPTRAQRNQAERLSAEAEVLGRWGPPLGFKRPGSQGGYSSAATPTSGGSKHRPRPFSGGDPSNSRPDSAGLWQPPTPSSISPEPVSPNAIGDTDTGMVGSHTVGKVVVAVDDVARMAEGAVAATKHAWRRTPTSPAEARRPVSASSRALTPTTISDWDILLEENRTRMMTRFDQVTNLLKLPPKLPPHTAPQPTRTPLHYRAVLARRGPYASTQVFLDSVIGAPNPARATNGRKGGVASAPHAPVPAHKLRLAHNSPEWSTGPMAIDFEADVLPGMKRVLDTIPRNAFFDPTPRPDTALLTQPQPLLTTSLSIPPAPPLRGAKGDWIAPSSPVGRPGSGGSMIAAEPSLRPIGSPSASFSLTITALSTAPTTATPPLSHITAQHQHLFAQQQQQQQQQPSRPLHSMVSLPVQRAQPAASRPEAARPASHTADTRPTASAVLLPRIGSGAADIAGSASTTPPDAANAAAGSQDMKGGSGGSASDGATIPSKAVRAGQPAAPAEAQHPHHGISWHAGVTSIKKPVHDQEAVNGAPPAQSLSASAADVHSKGSQHSRVHTEASLLGLVEPVVTSSGPQQHTEQQQQQQQGAGAGPSSISPVGSITPPKRESSSLLTPEASVGGVVAAAPHLQSDLASPAGAHPRTQSGEPSSPSLGSKEPSELDLFSQQNLRPGSRGKQGGQAYSIGVGVGISRVDTRPPKAAWPRVSLEGEASSMLGGSDGGGSEGGYGMPRQAQEGLEGAGDGGMQESLRLGAVASSVAVPHHAQAQQQQQQQQQDLKQDQDRHWLPDTGTQGTSHSRPTSPPSAVASASAQQQPSSPRLAVPGASAEAGAGHGEGHPPGPTPTHIASSPEHSEGMRTSVSLPTLVPVATTPASAGHKDTGDGAGIGQHAVARPPASMDGALRAHDHGDLIDRASSQPSRPSTVSVQNPVATPGVGYTVVRSVAVPVPSREEVAAEARHAALEEVEAELAGAQARKTKRDADRATKALQRMAGLPGAAALVSDSGTDRTSDGGVSRIRVAAAHSRAAVSPPAQRPTSAAPPSTSPSRRNTESTATPQTPPTRRTTPTTTTPATTPPDTKKKGSGGPADFRIKEAQTAVGQAQMQDIWTK